MRHKLIPVLLFLSASLELAAQTYEDQFTREYETIEFMSPTEWSFQKYMEHPISLYNGCPDVSINLFTLKDGEIELPITLRYNTSGIKVEEEASWVGLGWNLNMGGYVNRVVVGGFDERDQKLNQHKNIFYGESVGSVNTYGEIYVTNQIYDAIEHPIYQFPGNHNFSRLSPDVFFYSSPDVAGRYCIDSRDSTICHLKRKEDIMIEHYPPSYAWYDMSITTPKGIKHKYAYNHNSQIKFIPVPISETYCLTETEYPSGAIVYYDYETYSFERRKDSYSMIGTIPTSNSGPSDFKDQVYDPIPSYYIIEGQEALLSTISTPNYIISFVKSTREDSECYKLDYIEVIDKHTDNIIKKFAFTYDYFKNPNEATEDYNTLRLKLLNVKEVSSDNSKAIGRYDFEYNDTPLPAKNSYSYDHWGYPRDSISYYASSLPDLKELYWYKQNISDIRRISDAVQNPRSKSHNFDCCQAAMLTAITYPTGGRHEYKYGSNSFYGYYIPSCNEHPSNEFSTISNYIKDQNTSSDTRSCSFTTTGERVFHIDYHISRGLLSWGDIKESHIRLAFSTSSSSRELTEVYEKCCSLAYKQSADERIRGSISLTLPAGTHAFQLNLEDEIGNQSGASTGHAYFEATIWYKDATPAEMEIHRDTTSYGCGIRVEEIRYYDTGGTSPIMTKYYDYNESNGRSSGKLFNIPRYENIYYNAGYAYWAKGGYFLEPAMITAKQYEIFDKNLVSDQYGNASGVGYGTVTETISGISGKKVYEFHNTEAYETTHLPVICSTLNGEMLSETTYNAEGVIVKQIKMTYSNQLGKRFYGICLIDQLNKFPTLIDYNKSFWQGNEYYPNESAYYEGIIRLMLYSLDTYNVTLSRESIMQDGVTTITDYTYDPVTLLPITKRVQLSDGTYWDKSLRYPKDYNVFPYDYLYEKHILTPVVEERNKHNGIIFHSMLSEMDEDGNIDRISFGEGFNDSVAGIMASGYANSAIYPHCTLECLVRDFRGNPVHYKVNECEDIIYIWGYGYRYPIAEIAGVSFDDVQTALGCNPKSLSSAEYPDFDQLVALQETLSTASVTLYKYDSLGNITETIDPRGHSMVYEYDSFGRLIKIKRKNGSSFETIESFNYNSVK